MDAQVQPHTMARTQPASKGASDASKPGGGSSSTAGGPGPSVRNLLDHVLGDGVVPWSVEAGDDPTGLAAAAAAAGGVKVDADQMQQYGISQVCGCAHAGGIGKVKALLGSCSPIRTSALFKECCQSRANAVKQHSCVYQATRRRVCRTLGVSAGYVCCGSASAALAD